MPTRRAGSSATRTCRGRPPRHRDCGGTGKRAVRVGGVNASAAGARDVTVRDSRQRMAWVGGLTRDWLTRAGAHLGSLLRKWAIRFASSDGRDIVRDTPCLRSSVWTRANLRTTNQTSSRATEYPSKRSTVDEKSDILFGEERRTTRLYSVWLYAYISIMTQVNMKLCAMRG